MLLTQVDLQYFPSATHSSRDACMKVPHTMLIIMHMGGPHDITPFIKLDATGNCGFQLLCEQQHMTVDDELFTWYHDLASGQLVE